MRHKETECEKGTANNRNERVKPQSHESIRKEADYLIHICTNNNRF